MAKCKLVFIALSMAIIGFSCGNTFENNETTKIKEAIESSFLNDMNNPASYEFDQIRILDTLYVKDAYTSRIENFNDKVNLERSLIQRSDRQIKNDQGISKRLSTLREVFRVYGVNDQFDRIRNVISLYEQNNPIWIDRLNDLEREIRKSTIQTHRYRNELPLFDVIRTDGRNNFVLNDLIASSSQKIESMESEIQKLEQYIENNEEKMSEIAFFRVLFSHREENLFGGVQLIRKVHEVRFIDDSVELMWESQNFEANEDVLKAIKELSYGKGLEIIKMENELI